MFAESAGSPSQVRHAGDGVRPSFTVRPSHRIQRFLSP
jgi:hypothetical protein